LCEAFDRTDLLALRLDRERRARVDRLAVDDHRARAARPAVADAFHTGHLEPRAQRIEQRDARLELEPMHLAVDIEGDRNSARPAPARRGPPAPDTRARQ